MSATEPVIVAIGASAGGVQALQAFIGALPEKTKQLIAVAVAHVTQCPYCITGHTKLARRKGASPEEIMEAIWVAAEMRAGGAFAHAALAIHAMDRVDAHTHTPGVEGAPA